MEYVVTGVNARRMLRSLRSDRGAQIAPLSWSESVGSISSSAYTPLTEEGCTRLGMASAPTKRHPLEVIVPDASLRILGHDEILCQVISTALPGKPFVKVSHEFGIAGPELLFLDAAATMPFHRLLLFGMELCGTYTLRQTFPLGGRPVYQIEPATSVKKIEDAIDACAGARIKGVRAALEALPFITDNAASPMESVLALMLRLPISRGGLGLGTFELNPKNDIPKTHQRFTNAKRFYPDIYLERFNLDIEYESEEFHPEFGGWSSLDAVSRAAILDKSTHDKQRMRLIQSLGIKVFQATIDDFKTDAALDSMIEQLLMHLEGISDRSKRKRLQKLMGIDASSRRSKLLEKLMWNREA